MQLNVTACFEKEPKRRVSAKEAGGEWRWRTSVVCFIHTAWVVGGSEVFPVKEKKKKRHRGVTEDFFLFLFSSFLF